jgi:hypothetical protein
MTTNDPQNRNFDENWDFTRPGEYEEATKYYAGPFCSCGDYSCAAMRDEHANCSTAERENAPGCYYPQHWTEDDIDAFETEAFIDLVHSDNANDLRLASAQLA